MLYMGCSFENFSRKIEKNQKQIVTRFSDSELAVAAAPLRFAGGILFFLRGDVALGGSNAGNVFLKNIRAV